MGNLFSTMANTDNSSTTMIDPEVLKSDFVRQKSSRPLRVCCYGSSSSQTPEKYLRESRSVGYVLAKRGHTCVNGAGAFGCMAAMNDGAAAGNGHIVGVIHEIWLVDGPTITLRDGGAHSVFDSSNDDDQKKTGDSSTRARIELLVAKGKDLTERKRLLVEKANALVVLPGGPGTWDELWEMACARNLGLTKLPIVCVNVDGYYDDFRRMLERCWQDKMLKLRPEQVIHFVQTAEEAVRWVEDIQDREPPAVTLQKRGRPSTLRKSSFLSTPILDRSDSLLASAAASLQRSLSVASDWAEENKEAVSQWTVRGCLFAAGMAAGMGLVLFGGQTRGWRRPT